MTSIEFIYSPYLLLVAIPLIGLSLIPYFKIGKKYRRTRNRIISLVLHCLTIVLATFALSGITFVHNVSNTANELIILVDVSNTQNETADRRDGFIDDLLRESVYQNFTVGVVTFGLDQVYAVPLTTDVNSVFGDYLQAELPDMSATDIEAAIEYARTLFNHPESGKLVLITDGKETDGNIVSSSAVSALAAQGTIFDAVYISSVYGEDEYQLLNLKTPDVQVKKGAECTLEATIFSSSEGEVRINLYDNGYHVQIGKGDEVTDDFRTRLVTGTQTVVLPYKFTEEGMHKLKAEIVSVSANGARDEMSSNNAYFTYYNIADYKKVLVIEAYEGDSDKLREVLNDTEMLGESGGYDVSVFNLQTDIVTRFIGEDSEDGKVPESVDDLRQYDQVILNNVSNSDLTDREIPLDKLLYSYVYEYGGGMLTVGGNDPTGEAHAYNRKDMYGSEYQKMLPVEAVNYTPPVGVFIIVDVSGSMTGSSSIIGGYDRLHWARVGATACLGALSERDMIGILTLGDNYEEILPLTPRTEDQKIRDGISRIKAANSGTEFYNSVRYGTEQLRAAQMEKNHIIIVSDCQVSEKDMGATEDLVRKCYLDPRLNLTVSIVNIGGEGDQILTKNLVAATREDGWIIDGSQGCGYYEITSDADVDSIAYYMSSDVMSPLIKEIEQKEFQPIIFAGAEISQVVQGIERLETEEGEKTSRINATLGGYYGVKKRNLSDVELILTGDFQVPIYARWKYGKGSVGSFMCDLKGGDWSGDFMNSSVGKQLIYNMIDDLMPITDIRPQGINVSLSSKNYTNHLTCPTSLKDGETVRGTILTPDGKEVSLNQVGESEGCVVKRALSESNQYSVCEFLIKEGGVYIITIQIIDAEGKEISATSIYKEFSYSKEYDVEYSKTEDEIQAILRNLATIGNGNLLDETADVGRIFEEFETVLRSVYDPRLVLIILAVVLFLLDVAVRKFKFKWIHEIVRERKAQKAQNGQIRKEERYEKDN